MMHRKPSRLVLAAGACLIAGSPAIASPIADILAGGGGQPEASGLVAVTADRRGVVRAEAAGRAVIDAREPGRERALTPATPMRVASISKLVVAIAVMRLVEAGTLDLDRDVSHWLGWRLRNPAHAQAPVTLRQLLSHTSGVVDGPGYSFALGRQLRAELTPAHWSGMAPGGRFQYANLNYGIIGTVMEAATGERFDRLMTRLVLAPLRLDAGYNWSGASDAAVAMAAALYRRGEGGAVWAPKGPWVAQIDDLGGRRPACPVPVGAGAGCDLGGYRPGDNGTLFSPQGGLRISGVGLAKLGRLLLRGGEVDGVRLLTPRSVRVLTTPVWRDTGRATDDSYQGVMRCYGAGLQCLSGQAGASDQPLPGTGVAWVGHLGEAYGLYGGLWIDRAQGRVLVYLITGTSDDPYKAPHVSGFAGIEEAVLKELASAGAKR